MTMVSYFSYAQVYSVGVDYVMADRQFREPLSKFLRQHRATWRNAGIPSINRNDCTGPKYQPMPAPMATNSTTNSQILNDEYINQLYKDVMR